LIYIAFAEDRTCLEKDVGFRNGKAGKKSDFTYILVFYALKGWNLKNRHIKEVTEFVPDFI
jgi:hypothetical protein